MPLFRDEDQTVPYSRAVLPWLLRSRPSGLSAVTCSLCKYDFANLNTKFANSSPSVSALSDKIVVTDNKSTSFYLYVK